MKRAVIIACVLSSVFSTAQEVRVSNTKGGIVLSVSAEKPYQLMAGEEKLAMLSVECGHKGKKPVHMVTFSPGGKLDDDNTDVTSKGGQFALPMVIGGATEQTMWIEYGTPDTLAYFGKTEAERVKFIQTLAATTTVSISFKPFLTGIPITIVFDLKQLRPEMEKHPECIMQ